MIDKSLIMHFEDSIKQRQEDEKKLEYFLEENVDLKAKVKTLETRVAKKLEYFLEENLDLKTKTKMLESKLKSQQDVSMTLNMHLNATIEEIKMLRNTIAEMQNQMSHNQKPKKIIDV